MEQKRCHYCGKQLKRHIYGLDFCSERCFTMDVLYRTIDKIKLSLIEGKVDYAIVERSLFEIGSEISTGFFRGFGGRKFLIEYKSTGKIIETTNLWHLYDNLPDNIISELECLTAKFIPDPSMSKSLICFLKSVQE